MPFKIDEAGHIVTADVNGAKLPVFVHSDGKEAPFDAEHAVNKIRQLNGEAQGHRERAEAAETKLRAFDGIDDAEAARKALGTVRGLSNKELVAADQVEQMRQEAIKAVEAKYAPLRKERDTLAEQLNAQLIGGGFARSKLLTDPNHPLRLAIPADMAQAFFGRYFAVKDGKVTATDAHGNPIYSRSRPGEFADFDEALEQLVDAYPQRDRIVAASGSSGAGTAAPGRNGVVSGIKNPWSRDSFNLTEQGRLVRENPVQAEALRAAAAG